MKEAVINIPASRDLTNTSPDYFLPDVFTFLPVFFTGAVGFNSAARAAAKRAMGTRNGEQLT
jgi:hypothetical protein